MDEKLTMKEIAELASCARSTIFRNLHRYNIPTRKKGFKLCRLPMSNDLAYLLGAVASDGCVYHSKKGDYVIELRVRDKPFAEEFVRRLQALGFSAAIHSCRDGYYRVVKGCKEIYMYCKRISLPDFSILETLDQKRSFLRGYYDGDGSLTFSKKEGYAGGYNIHIFSVVEKRVELITDLLKEVGVHPHIYSQVCKTQWGSPRMYQAVISNRVDVIKFTREIGSSIPRKRPNLTLLDKNNYAYGYSDEELLEWLKEISMDIGRSPSEADVNQHPLGPRVGAYQDRFGSWNAAKRLAGLETYAWGRKDGA